MLTQDKYNHIIEKIEDIVQSRHADYFELPPDPKFVCTEALKAGNCETIDDRSINEIFKFLTGKTFTQYISFRLMMYAYSYLLNMSSYEPSPLINILGVSSEASLYKKFQDTFRLSAKDAFLKKDNSLYVPPAKWNTLSREEQKMVVQTIEVIKEVPVEIIKVDRKPYLFVSLAIIFLLIVFSIVGYCVHIQKKWAGTYVLFDHYCYTDDKIPSLCKDAVYDGPTNTLISTEIEIQPLKRKAVPNQNLNNYEITITSLKGNRIALEFKKGTSDFFTCNGERNEDGTILITDWPTDEKSQYTGNITLIEKTDYESWKKQWQGVYITLSQPSTSNGITLFSNMENTTTGIFIDKGTYSIIEINADESLSVHRGHITRFNKDTLSFYMEENPEEITCYAMGDAGFYQIIPDESSADTRFEYRKIGDYEESMLLEEWFEFN